MNMLISKRHIILAVLVVVLGTAVYLNWQFGSGNDDLIVSGSAESLDTEKNYGDAKLVSSSEEIPVNSVYFDEARLTRKQSRDEAVETLQKIVSDVTLDNEERVEATFNAEKMAASIESESIIENLIKAKGFPDCVAYIDGDKASILVSSSGLLETEVAQIKDIVIREASIPVENISIVEIN